MRAISAAQAAALDVELLRRAGFNLSSLVELAGQSVSLAVAAVYPAPMNVIVACGPGNNGADGLVAARYLAASGYAVTVVLPAAPSTNRAGTPSSDCHANALAQLKSWNVSILSFLPILDGDSNNSTVLVDAVFGFSFVGSPRPPFDSLLSSLSKASHSIPTVCVDVPSGWPVDASTGWIPPEHALRPAVLVSLTAPKLCAAAHTGPHFLGLGRGVVPPHLCQAFDVDVADISCGPGPLLRLR